MQKETSEVNFNSIFYITQYTQKSTIIATCDPYNKLLKRYIIYFFLKSSKLSLQSKSY